VIPYEWFEQAQRRIAAHVVETPLTYDDERALYLKWENHQVTGSFKARGALNKVLSLEDWERRGGLVAASAGNHGQGVALAARLTDSQVDVFVPAHAVPSKIEAMQDLGAHLHFVDGGFAQAEIAGREWARDQHRVFISPYNDGQVIAGQGTIALEILHQLDSRPKSTTPGAGLAVTEIANWIVPTGGGGLISACGAVIASAPQRPMLIGVQPEASAFTYSLYHRDTQQGVADEPTLADGLSGAIEESSVTIPMMKQYVSDLLVVSESAIARAIAFAWYTYHEKIEGSAAVALAPILEGMITTRPCLAIITGGNIQAEVFSHIANEYAGLQWN
jgi:threonine dehydratase